MGARKLVYACAALTPVWTLAVLGISGRFFTIPHPTPEYGPRVSQDILAYSVPVKTARLVSAKPITLDAGEVLAATDIWLNASESGELKDLPAAEADDNGLTGPRQEIDAAKRCLSLRLMREIRYRMDMKQYDVAAEVVEHCIKLAKIGKYNSPISVTNACTTQLWCMDAVEELREKTGKNPGPSLLAAIAETEPSIETVGKILSKQVTFYKIEADPDEIIKEYTSEQDILAELQVSASATDIDSQEAQRLVLLQSFRVAFDLESELDAKLREAKKAYKVTSPGSGPVRLAAR